jgi:hypothetical protein
MLGDNSLTSVTNTNERLNENNRRNLPLKHENAISQEEELTESIPFQTQIFQQDSSAKFVETHLTIKNC